MAAAMELFASRGYEETTLEEVAEAAGLHVQTLYRHFPSKQHLATAGEQDYLERFRRAIEDPARAGDTLTFWRRWVSEAASSVVDDGGDRYRRYLKSRAALPAVASRLKAIQDEYEDLLTASLARDFGETGERISTARLVAGMLLAGNSYVLRCYAAEDFDLAAEAVGVTTRVEALFGHLVKAADRADAVSGG
jgi:AcrR family transcriptional regulator